MPYIADGKAAIFEGVPENQFVIGHRHELKLTGEGEGGEVCFHPDRLTCRRDPTIFN
ncbi:hypothetical protein [Noviherbaspirillum malthae]|uniref:hypothetical protein n=1 Tax=Noviherbaspirillum malthae TaxID=1260987 RepID=UPI00188FF59A|nr:hypothetical protein [Noviherbaspirillum malthae]